jgi:hypothetical protein
VNLNFCGAARLALASSSLGTPSAGGLGFFSAGAFVELTNLLKHGKFSQCTDSTKVALTQWDSDL